MKLRASRYLLGASLLLCIGAVGWAGDDGRDNPGGGGQPDPLSVFNQHVELASGEFYLLKGQVVMAPGIVGSSSPSRRTQAYFDVDLDAHPWLASKQRREAPMYLIEGTPSAWRAYEGSYGELAAEAHQQLFVDSSGKAVQVISLSPILELSSIPRRAR